jgi:GT2 family glycosyltransferase
VIDLAVVIVNYNVRELLRACLAAVFDSEGELAIRVCVVDNASSDGSTAMVARDFPEVALVANDVNVGYPAGNNQGLRRLGATEAEIARRPRYCLLLNPDTVVPADAFRTFVAYMDDHPGVGAVGPRLVLPDGRLDLACRRSFPTPEVSLWRMVGLSKLLPRSRRFGRYNLTYLDPDQLAEVDSVVGAFMMVRRETIDEVGLMDERFWMYGEDLDWAKRMKDAGWQVVYNPAVTVVHVKRASSRQNGRAQTEFYRAMLIFYYKHYYLDTPRFLHWLVILGIAALGGRPVLGAVAAGPAILQGPTPT